MIQITIYLEIDSTESDPCALAQWICQELGSDFFAKPQNYLNTPTGNTREKVNTLLFSSFILATVKC